MTPNEIGALLAYADRLAPRYAPQDQTAAAERYRAFGELLSDVPATAPHPDGRDWNAAHAARKHLAESPYPLQASDITRPWLSFKADVLRRHHDPLPTADPDDPESWRAELLGTRTAVATGQAAPAPYRELLGRDFAARDRQAAERLAALGTYVPRTVAQQLATYRPRRAERERLAAANLPDPLSVPCDNWCHANVGEPCRSISAKPGRDPEQRRRPRSTPHPTRAEAARQQAAREAS